MKIHHYTHGMFLQKVEAAKDNIERLKALAEYMKDHAHDVQSYLHHKSQGSVYHGKSID